MSGRSYLSIGDVLTLLRQEFPDVTISKIRFLESQGLVNPERTPSGYRKFYEPDVERLRWVLRQQREHFLPLKVIKGRLEEVGEGQGNGHPPSARRSTAVAEDPGAPSAPAAVPAARRGAAGPSLPGMGGAQGGSEASARRAMARRASGTGTPVPGATAVQSAKAESPSGASRASRASGASGASATAASPSPARRSQRDQQAPAVLAEGDMTAEELGATSGCPPGAVAALESYGLLTSRSVGGVCYYGEDALVVARLAAAFAAFGVEPRHLRLYKHAAEREAGFVEQVVLPLLKQRNPESRQRADDTVSELSRLGRELHDVMLAKALRDQLGG